MTGTRGLSAVLIALALGTTACAVPPKSASYLQSGQATPVTPTLPRTETGPPSTATPVFVLTVRPAGGTCAVDKTLVPQRVVYSDGTVLDTDSDGFFCEPVPFVTAGRIDLTWFRSRLDAYVAAVDPNLDLTHPTGSSSTADGEVTALTYTDSGGSVHRINAYQLDDTVSAGSDALDRGRAALTALLTDVSAHVTDPGSWAPRRLEVVKASTQGPPDAGSVTWPLPVSPAVAGVAGGAAGGCVVVTGTDVSVLLTADPARRTLVSWRVDGTVRSLAFGVVLPGMAECRSEG